MVTGRTPNGRFPIKQEYTEEGIPYYPITLFDLICGTDEQKRKLQNIGASIRQIDLSEYIYLTYAGTLDLYILNDFIYLYEGHITYTEAMAPFPVDEDLIIARDIPPLYRSTLQIIHCSALSGTNDRLVCWIDTTGKLYARITPRYVYKDERHTIDYMSTVTSLDFNGLFFRVGEGDDIFDGSSTT